MSAQRLASFRRCAIYEEPSWRCCCSPRSCSAACGSSATNGENPVKASGVLRVGTEGVYSPFSYHDPATGQLVGYDVDVAQRGRRQARRESRIRRDAMGCDLRRAGGQPIRRGRQRGDDQRRTQSRSTTSPSRTRSAKASSSPGPTTTPIKSLDDIKGKVAGETATSNWAQVARDARCAGRGRRGLHPGDQAAQPGPGRRGGQRQHRGVRLPRRDRRQVGQDRRERQARRASRASPPARTAGCCPT